MKGKSGFYGLINARIALLILVFCGIFATLVYVNSSNVSISAPGATEITGVNS